MKASSSHPASSKNRTKRAARSPTSNAHRLRGHRKSKTRRPHSVSTRAEGRYSQLHLPTLELYQKEDCPRSHRVRRYLTEMGLDFVSHSVPDNIPRKHQEVTQVGGKDQIPLLVDHRTGRKLYEASAIVDYLKDEYGSPRVRNRPRWLKTWRRLVWSPTEEFRWSLRTPLERAGEWATGIADRIPPTTRRNMRVQELLGLRRSKTR